MWAALLNRLRSSGWPIFAAAGVVGVFIIAGGLSPLLGGIGFAVLLLVTVFWNASVRPAEKPAPSLQLGVQNFAWPHLQAVIDALPDPAIAIDSEGNVVALNARANEIAPALRIREHISLVLRAPELNAAVRDAIATRKPQHAEYSERVPVERWHEAYVIPIAVDAGARATSGLVLLTFHELTPHRRMEQMRVDFIANASHELRTPLAALSGFIETLRGPARDDPVARERFLTIMEGQASRMARLIDDLLSLSRIELREHVEPDAPTDLAPIIRQVIDTMQPLAQERGVEVTFAAPEEPLMVRGDRDELIRVFENLTENGLKYGASGKRVDVRLETSPGKQGEREARVLVRDYGPGIAPEHLPRLTERFYRVDVGQSRTEGGTGLGLALVKHILNRHHGQLTIESAQGEGSTFIVCLPLTLRG